MSKKKKAKSDRSKATRFQPGESGNPKGRPRGTTRENLDAVLQRVILTVLEAGGEKALQTRLLRAMDSGSQAEIRILEYAFRRAVRSQEREDAEAGVVGPYDGLSDDDLLGMLLADEGTVKALAERLHDADVLDRLLEGRLAELDAEAEHAAPPKGPVSPTPPPELAESEAAPSAPAKPELLDLLKAQAEDKPKPRRGLTLGRRLLAQIRRR